MIKAILFDMDGVLIDARDWHYESLNKSLSLFGLEISRYEHLNFFDGLPTKTKLEILSKEGRIPSGLHDFINRMKQQYTTEIIISRCKPVFLHQYALSYLRKKGFRLAVCSNSIRNSVSLMMEKADLLKYLEFFISNEDVINPKPHPEIYLKAIANLGFKPEECLIVEDNENGLKAALASGAHVLKVASPAEVSFTNIITKITAINSKSN